MEENIKNTSDIQVKNNNLPYVIIIILLIIIAVLAFFLWKNFSSKNINASAIWKKWVEITLLVDKTCPEGVCLDVETLKKWINTIPLLIEPKITVLDYNNKDWKKLYDESKIDWLPAIFLNTNDFWESKEALELKQALEEKWKSLYLLNIWASYSPIKVDKPVADLYIMSYCPFWLQAQKWYLEVMSKLWKVADINIKFVPYLMHWKKEWEENIVQHCIQEEQKEKYIPYLNCFLAEEWKEAACRKEVKIDEKKLSACVDKTKKDINYDETVEKSTEQYPKFNLNLKEAGKAWVQWSPTLVLNWKKIEQIWRNAKAYADIICSSFKDKPEECNQEFQNVVFDPMFGFTSWNWANIENSACWVQ